MRYFKKLPSISLLVLPGIGRVYDRDILAGDTYAHHCPHLLYETDAEGNALSGLKTRLSQPSEVPIVPVEPVAEAAPAADSPPDEKPATIEVRPIDPPKRKRGRPRKVPQVSSPEEKPPEGT